MPAIAELHGSLCHDGPYQSSHQLEGWARAACPEGSCLVGPQGPDVQAGLNSRRSCSCWLLVKGQYCLPESEYCCALRHYGLHGPGLWGMPSVPLSGLEWPFDSQLPGSKASLTGQPDNPCKGPHHERQADCCSERGLAKSLVTSPVCLNGWQLAGLIWLRI